MMESKYASSVAGNLFWAGALRDVIEEPSSPDLIVGGLDAIVEFVRVFPPADLLARDINGRSPLCKAAAQRMEGFGLGLMKRAKQMPEISHRIMDARDHLGQTILNLSICYSCSLPFIEALIQHGAQVNPANLPSVWTPLQTASFFGYSDVVDLLLRCGAKVDGGFPGIKSAQELAQEQGHLDIVGRLGFASQSFLFRVASDQEQYGI
jgi:ankyrin repeat protein